MNNKCHFLIFTILGLSSNSFFLYNNNQLLRTHNGLWSTSMPSWNNLWSLMHYFTKVLFFIIISAFYNFVSFFKMWKVDRSNSTFKGLAKSVSKGAHQIEFSFHWEGLCYFVVQKLYTAFFSLHQNDVSLYHIINHCEISTHIHKWLHKKGKEKTSFTCNSCTHKIDFLALMIIILVVLVGSSIKKACLHSFLITKCFFAIF